MTHMFSRTLNPDNHWRVIELEFFVFSMKFTQCTHSSGCCMKDSHAIKLWADEWFLMMKADSLVYHLFLSISVIFINIEPQATAWKLFAAHIREHQCDKRLLRSIQNSIRNVDAHEINLPTCNITNFMKYGEIDIVMRWHS